MKNVLLNNLKFEYLYRDAGNYKQFGFIVLNNPSNLDPDTATSLIRKHLIDGEFFYPKKVQIPLIERYKFDFDLDHQWYEFENFSFTNEIHTDPRSVETFINSFILQ
ncbi:MAG: hypothetical protein D8M58_09800 [Calditrichaeota bacterium]|nr:MAG: hypothetical protein DWQ03_09175 [Calditrichota bacterium]MBL1205682.1 hypothetical protein [Calditrichota bacterium]NOG45510.1 hypothetical protein [Calditrichota bacterium]